MVVTWSPAQFYFIHFKIENPFLRQLPWNSLLKKSFCYLGNKYQWDIFIFNYQTSPYFISETPSCVTLDGSLALLIPREIFNHVTTKPEWRMKVTLRTPLVSAVSMHLVVRFNTSVRTAPFVKVPLLMFYITKPKIRSCSLVAIHYDFYSLKLLVSSIFACSWLTEQLCS